MNSNKMGPHTFHIPVMGTSFTIDSPLKVGRFGISSVVSIVDDILAEKMRKYYCEREGLPFEAIEHNAEDRRARRITAYLEMMQVLLDRQTAALRSEPFEAGTEITRYFEMLPDGDLRSEYEAMLACADEAQRLKLQDELRMKITPGAIDVNIMTKIDRDRPGKNGEPGPVGSSDALSAFRGFAQSSLSSSVVLSAGLNPRLYAYMNKFKDFLPDAEGLLKKKLILKVSDFRSAAIQGKFLAKHGLWVSEYRIESGINCGGHAFVGPGSLMGPILDEFRARRSELTDNNFNVYVKGLASLGLTPPAQPADIRITVQGGIGTAEENDLFLRYYEVDATGWGTPFLLVPEASTVDEEHIRRLINAKEGDVWLSDSSPFGIPFWNLHDSDSERRRQANIDSGEPGYICTSGFLKLNTEFGTPASCSASKSFVKKKMDFIDNGQYSEEQQNLLRKEALAKACLCRDLAGCAMRLYNIEPEATPCICTGQNIVNFDRVYTLEEMVSHIYGRISLITNSDRPHVLLKELMLYIEYLKKELERYSLELSTRPPKYFAEFRENLLNGIEHYRALADQFIEEKKSRFLEELGRLQDEIENMKLLSSIASPANQVE